MKLYWVGSGKGGVYATLPLPRCVVPLCILCTHDEINVTWMRGVLQLRLLKLWLQVPNQCDREESPPVLFLFLFLYQS